MAIDAKLQIKSGDQKRRIGGFDSMIVEVVDEDLTSVNRAMIPDTNVLTPKLVDHSHEAARRMGERLHHADWTVTDDQDKVMELTLMHDCPTCRDGRENAIRYMRSSGKAVLVGHLYWVHPED